MDITASKQTTMSAAANLRPRLLTSRVGIEAKRPERRIPTRKPFHGSGKRSVKVVHTVADPGWEHSSAILLQQKSSIKKRTLDKICYCHLVKGET